MRSVTQTRSLGAADPDGICLNQSTGGAANLTIDGAFASGGVATLDAQRQVELESLNNLSAVNFTIVGTDDSGQEVRETISGPNAGVAATAENFRTVTEVSVDAAVTDVEVGTNGVGGSQEIPMDRGPSPFNASLAIIITGTVDVTAEYTFDEVFADNSGPFTWFPHTDLTNITADAEAALVAPVKAVRLLTNSGDGTARFEVNQAGII